MKLRVPHTFVLLFALVALAAIATHLLPAGEYQRTEVGGRQLVDPDSYRPIAARPATLGDVFLAWPRGLAATASIVFYIFIIGGAFGVLQATGALDALIAGVVAAARGRGEVILPALMLLFAIGGGTIGMAEETLPFLPGLVLLAKRLGYDEVVGGAIALVGAGAGFAGAFMNPFTVGVGQAIAGLPLFSGMGYRLIVWFVLTTVTIVYVAWYAGRHRVALPANPGPPASAGEPPAFRLANRQAGVLAILFAAFVLLAVGCLRWEWGLLELSALFVAVGVAGGLVGGLGSDGTAEEFLKGASAFAGAALVVGLARGVLVIFDAARVTDGILHAMAQAVRGLPEGATVAGIYFVQIVLSYLVPSGSGQAALSLPILTPLADLTGVTRQTSVLAYQFGDGFSNIFTPTQGYFMAGLALIGVPWTRWVKFLWPLQVIWLVLGLVFLLIAQAMRWGPF
ncbi:MAG: YfcC family protein [Thermoanaerobaculia bacterium]|nr:YfcC family protein [Thermoanaerobaculia bacterium]MBP9825030.1 YfcC family protein [Thermoanaerobaculia bacterium]